MHLHPLTTILVVKQNGRRHEKQRLNNVLAEYHDIFMVNSLWLLMQIHCLIAASVIF